MDFVLMAQLTYMGRESDGTSNRMGGSPRPASIRRSVSKVRGSAVRYFFAMVFVAWGPYEFLPAPLRGTLNARAGALPLDEILRLPSRVPVCIALFSCGGAVRATSRFERWAECDFTQVQAGATSICGVQRCYRTGVPRWMHRT